MTRKHFELMAAYVRAILAGTTVDSFAAPWADSERLDLTDNVSLDTLRYREAVNVAQAFAVIGLAANPAFSKRRFLVACGLVTK